MPFRRHRQRYNSEHVGKTLNNDNSTRAKTPETTAKTKKPYQVPSFRFEAVFEVSALACGKVHVTQAPCHASRKAS